MGLISTEAIVLGAIKLGEADKLATFYTLERGKLKGVASGARRMKSRFGAVLEPFSHIRLIIFEKGGDKLSRVNQADMIHSFQSLREDWDSIERAARMVALVSQMTVEGQAQREIFDLLLQGLFFLDEKKSAALSVLLFMDQLLRLSGYQPNWQVCQGCGLVLEPAVGQKLFFSEQAGGVICRACAQSHPPLLTLAPSTRAFLSAAQKMDFKKAHRLRPSTQMFEESEKILGAFLSYLTGKSSKSRLSLNKPFYGKR